MARQRVIVGLGEAVLVEHPDRTEASGLAAEVAMQAVRLGHHGVVISRIGQDEQARELMGLLEQAGVDVSHIQTDPDLPTARIIVRPIGGRVERYLEARAGFDNLQCDFDLEDVAQQADAVIYGLLSRRGGQTRSEENRFLHACGAAMKIFDLTNRAGDEIQRGQASTGLEHADGAIVDSTALHAVLPGTSGLPLKEAANALAREVHLSLIATLEPCDDGQRRLTLHAGEMSPSVTISGETRPYAASIVGMLHALLRGRGVAEAADLAARLGAHTVEHGGDPIPEAWLTQP
jgi:sugar/nucleoside kinase (ribokinase family)